MIYFVKLITWAFEKTYRKVVNWEIKFFGSLPVNRKYTSFNSHFTINSQVFNWISFIHFSSWHTHL